MGVGHLAAGLILKRVEPRINLGFLFFAALLSDFLLGVFYWAGLEHAYVPDDFPRLHYLRFNFPYSHGLLATVFWSAMGFLLTKYFCRNHTGTRLGMMIALAVFSHFILDVVVHERELPLLGQESPLLGFGLWNHLALAALLEIMLVVVGLILYLPAARAHNLRKRSGVLLLMVVFSVLTVGAMTSSTPPDLTAAAVSWIAAPLVLSAIAFWLDSPQAQPSIGRVGQ
ncbi:MAG TPA: hypothetical protein VLX11_11760 [Candidatus Acidoferrales bacterium]|nr:hypothetical protein [Candidatus Acidoferrales bacterium]